MNPDTNELVKFSSVMNVNDLKKDGFILVPQSLEQAAKLMLRGKKSVIVSKTSGGKLSKWAAEKRREAKKCNEYYDNLK